MSANEHTPGPWTVGEDGRGVWGQVDGVERRLLDIRRTGGLDCSYEANARLAAAAPDLLAACEAAAELFTLDGHGGCGLDECAEASVLALLRSAIAAAAGGGR